MTSIETGRIIQKAVALGVIRELLPPETHIITRLIAPWLNVESDDVIFDLAPPFSVGLAPARAEDSEAEMAAKDDFVGSGKASLIDWALKDHYAPSDISKYREVLGLSSQAGLEQFPLVIQSIKDGFEQNVARDTARRRRKLDNRIEWLGTQALEHGVIEYNDTKIIFDVDYQRPGPGDPVDQTSGTLPSGASVTPWTEAEADPIGNFDEVDEYMYDTYGVHTGKVIGSPKAWRNVLNSEKFLARANLAGSANPNNVVDPRYLIDGWGQEAALNVLQRSNGLTYITYDSVFRTRAIDSQTTVNKRFLSEDKLIFLPSDADIAEMDVDSQLGFAKTLSSPHPEGNWSAGYYEWEKDTGPDPWGYDFGTGVKAFPVFPHLDLTYVLKVL